MGLRIFKYTLRVERGPQDVIMPLGARVLSVQFQGDELRMWPPVDPNAHGEGRLFEIFGTGWDVPDAANINHVATVQYHGFVWHVFEHRAEVAR